MNIETEAIKILTDAQNAVNLGHMENALKIITSGESSLCEFTDQEPHRIDVINAVAKVFRYLGNLEKAEKWYKKLLKHQPDASIYNELGRICELSLRLCDAAEYYKKAAELADNDEYKSNLAACLIRTAKTEEGISIFRDLARKRTSRDIHSNYLSNLHYLPCLDEKLLFDEHTNWAKIHAPMHHNSIKHENDFDPNRKLKIGYVSPDFCEHSVNYFFEPLLDAHNRSQFEIFGYGNVEFPDAVTERLKNKFNHYRNIFGIDDDQATNLIRQDRIDILVDLAGHTRNRRLGIFAQKPAPIQASYLGYPDTTGMKQMDYRFTDNFADTPQSQQFYTEKLLYLPDCFLCYHPSELAPPVSDLPYKLNKFITFGSLNNNCKINPVIIQLWAQILNHNPQSRFIMKSFSRNQQQLKDYYIDQFAKLGVDESRIEIIEWLPKSEHFKIYEKIDIALDTYPYNGTTTTCQALWMGVPVISLTGSHHASRVGLSILSRTGLDFFAAKTPQEYVLKANALASKPEAIAKLRSSMRARIACCGLCCAKALAADIETAYRRIWTKKCTAAE